MGRVRHGKTILPVKVREQERGKRILVLSFSLSYGRFGPGPLGYREQRLRSLPFGVNP